MRRRDFLTFAGSAAAYPLVATAQPRSASIGAGAQEQTINVGNTQLLVSTYRAAKCRDPSLLLAFHGSERSSKLARDATRHFADRHCLIVLAPYFDEERFPLWRYNWGGVINGGEAQEPGTWTGNLALELVEWARRAEGRNVTYAMIGHSAGAQYLCRLAAYVPNQARRIILANPGAYVLPRLDVSAPYGFGKLYSPGDGEEAMKRYLAQPLIIMLGEKDTEPDPRDGEGAKSQGSNRLERGINAFSAGRQVAEARGWPFNWRLIRIPGVGHSSKDMYASPAASSILNP
jgi:poly(3-hydroxybutyrate) depolymerase